MLKMFSTQLTGLFNRIQEKEEFAIEDAARLLAQAVIGDGSIYIYGQKEMSAVISEGLYGTEPLKKGKVWYGTENGLTDADRVLIFTRFSHDAEAVAAARWLYENRIPFVSISTHVTSETNHLVEMADVHVDLHLKKPLLPDEEGNRFGFPASILALFVYHSLKFTLDEILAEYEE